MQSMEKSAYIPVKLPVHGQIVYTLRIYKTGGMGLSLFI